MTPSTPSTAAILSLSASAWAKLTSWTSTLALGTAWVNSSFMMATAVVDWASSGR